MSLGNAADIGDQVEAALTAGDPYRARQLAERGLRSLTNESPAADWASNLGAVARLAQQWGDDILLTAATRGRDNPDDGTALWSVGHRLIDKDLLAMAEAVLVRAMLVEPSPQIVAELVAALELQGRYEDAVEALRNSGLAENDPLCSFLLAFSCAMLRDLEPARSRLPQLDQRDDEPFRTMAASLRGMVQRAEVLGSRLKGDGLREWHFVWTGGVLLTSSPPSPHSGLARWSDLRRALEAVATSLGELQTEVDRVLAPPDRASQILGHAAAALLERPLATWRGNGERGLLVVYDELDLDVVLRNALRRRQPDQPLYVHVADATREQPAAGDLTALYGRGYRTPWLGGVDDAGDVIMPEEGSPEDLACRLLADALRPTDRSSPDDDQELLQFVSLVAPTIAAAVHQGGERSRQWVLPKPFRDG